MKPKKSEDQEIWSWGNLKLKKFEVEEIWSWINLKLTYGSEGQNIKTNKLTFDEKI